MLYYKLGYSLLFVLYLANLKSVGRIATKLNCNNGNNFIFAFQELMPSGHTPLKTGAILYFSILERLKIFYLLVKLKDSTPF